MVAGGIFRDHEREARAPFSARSLAGYFLYALGTAPMMRGIDLVQQQSGWSRAGLAMLAAVVIVAAGFALLVVVRLVRRRRGRASP